MCGEYRPSEVKQARVVRLHHFVLVGRDQPLQRMAHEQEREVVLLGQLELTPLLKSRRRLVQSSSFPVTLLGIDPA